MAYPIKFKSSVLYDLSHLDPPIAERIIREIEKILGSDPNSGDPLSGEFKRLFRYRIGEYRVIYTRYPDSVLILRIGHRRSVYR